MSPATKGYKSGTHRLVSPTETFAAVRNSILSPNDIRAWSSITL